MTEPIEKDLEFFLCVIANVICEPHEEGVDNEIRLGTKHFAPGCKVYLIQESSDRVYVFGRHRGSSRLVPIYISAKLLDSWRVSRVYDPKVHAAFSKNSWCELSLSENIVERVRLQEIVDRRNRSIKDC